MQIHFKPNAIQQRTLYFAGRSHQDEIQALRKVVQDVDGKMDDVIFHPNNRPLPPTRVQSGWQKAKTGFITGGAILLAGLLSLGGYLGFRSYQKAKPSDETVGFHNAIHPDWQTLKGTAEAARKTGQVENPQHIQEFNNAVEGLMTRLTLTMEHAPGKLDKELVKQLKWTSTHMNKDVANKLASQFFRFMEGKLKEQGVDADTAEVTHVQAIKEDAIVTGALNKMDELNRLSAEQKNALAKELRRKFIELQETKSAYPTSFSGIMMGALDSPIKGVTLKQFAEVQTREDAIKLFTAVVQNADNYRELTAEQRQGFVDRGAEILNSLDYDSPPLIWAIATFTLLALAGLGTVGLTLLKGQKVVEGLTSVADFYHGLTQPLLLIQEDGLANPESKRLLAMMAAEIDTIANDIEKLIQEEYDNNPETRALLKELHQDKANLPTAQHIKQRFIHEAKVAILAERTFSEKLNETPVAELAFVQRVFHLMEDAYTKGNFVTIGLPQELSVPQPADPNEAVEPLEKLRRQERYIEYNLGKARKFWVNRSFNLATVNSQIKAQEQKKAVLEQEVRSATAAQKEDSSWKIEKANQLGALKDELNRLETRKKDAELILIKARLELGKQVADLRQLQRDLEAAVHKVEFAKNVTELQALQSAGQAMLKDPKLEELLVEAEMKRILSLSDTERDLEMTQITQSLEASASS